MEQCKRFRRPAPTHRDGTTDRLRSVVPPGVRQAHPDPEVELYMKSIKTAAVSACALVALGVAATSATAGQPAKTTPLGYTPAIGSCDGTTPGSVSIAGGVAKLGVPEQMSYAQIVTSPGNLKLSDVTRLTFRSQASDAGVVYMKITTEDGRSVVYSPNTQLGGETGLDTMVKHNVLTGTVRLNDDRGEQPDLHWNQVLAQAGDAQIKTVSFTAGCANPVGADGAKVQYDDLTINNKVASFTKNGR
jgi:hypothetical protein